MAYNGKRLHKSDSDKKLCGVCGGIAEYFNIDPTIVRLGWIIFCLPCRCEWWGRAVCGFTGAARIPVAAGGGKGAGAYRTGGKTLCST